MAGAVLSSDVDRSPAAVSLEGVSKWYDNVPAVQDFTIDAEAGEFLVLLGPSGCGKTTVLRLIAGLEIPSQGVIRIGGQVVNDVDPRNRDIAMVFQSYALYPHMTVRRNIEFPLRSRGHPAPARSRMVEEVARSLQLDKLLDRKPAQLSGGQRQRVALARAIVRRPLAFLMDEPLSNLDAQLRIEMRAELVELHAKLDTTIIYVTHDQVEATTMGNRIAVIDQSRLQQVGTPREVYEHPANAFVAGFVGNPPMNIIRGHLEGEGDAMNARFQDGYLQLPPVLAAAARRENLGEVLIGIRPQDLQIVEQGTIHATVSLVEVVGSESRLVCRFAGGQFITVDTDRDPAHMRNGDVIDLAVGRPRREQQGVSQEELRSLPEVPPEALHLFDVASGRRLDP
ncbi:MAG: ABC transporter ATP-binding protein [Actinobacteria bacterium]|nr:ABC transporter ATP-binding protein [Actinomycetota bacterium]MCL5446882.1 ABC transporter ATP-binding protein [Actinomycetota bacterium]